MKDDFRKVIAGWQEAEAAKEADLRRRIGPRRESGFPTPQIAATICQGAVFVIDDDVVVLPESRIGGVIRAEHESRRVVVLSSALCCGDPTLKTVQVAPCNGHPPPSPPHRLDYQLPAAEDGFTLAARIFVSLAQPVLKADFTSRRMGVVNSTTLAALLARWAMLQGR